MSSEPPRRGVAKRERQPDQPTAPHPQEVENPVERAKDAMRKAGENARRIKRSGAEGRRGSISEG